MGNLLPVCAGKKISVMCAQILLVHFPLEYKFGLSYALFHRCFCLVSDFSNFHMKLEKLK